MKNITLWLVGLSSLLFTSIAAAGPIEQLTDAASYHDWVNDGKTQDRSRKCNHQSGLNLITRSGLNSEWKSRTEEVTVFDDRGNKRLIITADVECVQKQQKKAGCGGWVEDTKWRTYKGSMTMYVGMIGGWYDPSFFIKQDSTNDLPGNCSINLAKTIGEKIKKIIPDIQ